MQKITISIACAALITLSACSVHKVDVQQGNVITPEMRAQIKVGMSKRQVSFVLGSPLLIDPLHRDRWDYLYSLSQGRKRLEIQRLALFFEGDKLIRVDDHTLPGGTPSPPLPAPATPTEPATPKAVEPVPSP
jgi:outer membrane protein assembly factor BamE